VVVTDDGAGLLEDRETITVTVSEVNVAPVLDPVGAQSGDEGTLITFTATATDPDVPGSVTFTLEDGAGVVPTLLEDRETITVTVNEVNVAPVLDAVGAQSGDEGTLIGFTATATDPDVPANTLSFSLEDGAGAAGCGCLLL
jgi:hypothetical protein